MSRARRFLGTSFGSALLGGAVVGAFFWIAIGAGWIEGEGSSTSAIPAPLATPVANKGDEDATLVNQIYRRDGQGVAFIEATQPPAEPAPSPFFPFGEEEPRGGGVATGSGFVIDGKGRILTNNHVVEGATEIAVTLGSSNSTHAAKVVGTDPASDIALLEVDAPKNELHPLALGDSSKVQVGDPVVAIGNPFGLDRTVTSGIVSALQRQIEAPNGFSINHVIQTDAAINPGNSGGPLIDAAGNVIGINSQIATGGGGGNVGIGFAVPINTARDVVNEIEQNGKVEHAYLGINGGTITPDLAKAVNLPVDEGVLLAEVVEGGPADKAGLRGGTTEATIEGARLKLGGDIVTEIDGEPIASMEDLIDVVDAKRPGDEIELTVLRGGETRQVTVTLEDRPASAR